MIQINQKSSALAVYESEDKITHSEFKLLKANTLYMQNGNHNYFVDECFKNTDIIVPVEMMNKAGLTEPAKKMQELCDKVDIMSLSTMHSDKDSRRNSDVEQDFSAVMMKRWESHIQQTIPPLDQQDVQKDCPLITQVETNEDTVSQHAPEFTQLAYLRLRSIEEVFALRNYLDPTCNPKLQTYLTQNKMPNGIKFESGRAYGMRKLIDLHRRKGYRFETLFAAQNIFDRYLNMVGHWTMPDKKYVLLATISILMSAKLEQDTSPSFNRMIGLLTNDEYKHVSKQALIELELEIITMFGFDFNFPGPVETMERFLRILGYNKNTEVDKLSRSILKHQIRLASLLNYRPSQVAACAVIIAINIKQNKSLTNLDIWNNEKTSAMTGYSIEMLRQPI